ncbi:MAG TPA: hypothetical protein VMD05_03190 [Candidatus Nanoarchaeia archaeon]|nr:hypothetical protein [Candidatus Nanoarchaeia archaeon]
MKFNRKLVFFKVVFVAASFLIIFSPILFACAQSSTNLDSESNFAIPALNGDVNFAFNGTYAQASLENNTWTFVDLQFSDFILPIQNLSISAVNCNVTVASYRTFNVTIVGISLSYFVEGQGNQTFHFSPIQRGGDWSVSFNRSFIGENGGWSLSPGGTLTVYKAPSGSNVTLTYFVFPDTLGGNGNNSNLPFDQQHSVIIATGIAVTITVIVVVAIAFVSKRNRKLAEKESLR